MQQYDSVLEQKDAVFQTKPNKLDFKTKNRFF